MKLKNIETYTHDSYQHVGILLINLGTPEYPSIRGVRRYLRNLLSDPRVVELPRWFWLALLYFIILPIRSRKSTEKYAKIWSSEGSPLFVFTKKITLKLETLFRNKYDIKSYVFEYAMLCSQPRVREALKKLREKNCNHIFILNMFPQYASPTVGSSFEMVTKELQKWRWVPELRFCNHYHDHPLYIQALVSSILSFRAHHDASHKTLIFSFHGLPYKSLLKGDPYYCQCQKTARLVVEALGLKMGTQAMVTFQSRFGREAWLQPYTDQVLLNIARNSETSKEVQIISPSFSVDCLETLEELNIENKELFLKAGGVSYEYIPCLNDSDEQIVLYEKIIEEYTKNFGIQKQNPDMTQVTQNKIKEIYHTKK